MQGRLAQELHLELEAAGHRAELQAAELQQRLRLSEEACAAARADASRLKQEQHEDARMMEVGGPITPPPQRHSLGAASQMQSSIKLR